MDKKNEPVKLTGKVNVNKSGEGKKFLKLFFTGSFKDALKYAFDNVFIPYTKDAICRTSTNVVNYWVNGDKPSVENRAGANRVSYWRDSSVRNTYQATAPAAPKQSNNVYSTGDITYEKNGDAEVILKRLQECIDVYDVATVADLYDLSSLKYSYTDYNYGWKDLSSAKVVRIFDNNEGKWVYSLDLPKAMPIK